MSGKTNLVKNPYIDQVRISGELVKNLWQKRWVDFHFSRGVNILCGPNGSGKSTIIRALFPESKKKKDDFAMDMNIEDAVFRSKFKAKVKGVDGGMVRRFDFEKDNPRAKRGLGMMALSDFQMWGLGNSLRSMSHGEAQKKLFDMLLNPEATLHSTVLLDEPEQALDLDGLFRLRNTLHSARNQFVVATHSPILILYHGFNIIETVPGYRARIADAVAEALAFAGKGATCPEKPTATTRIAKASRAGSSRTKSSRRGRKTSSTPRG